MSLSNPPGAGAKPGDKYSIWRWMVGGLLLNLLACNIGVPLISKPTPTTDLTQFEVQVQMVPSPTPRLLSLIPTPAADIPTDTPLPGSSPTLEVTPEATPELGPSRIVEPTTFVVQSTEEITPTNTSTLPQPSGDDIYNGNVTALIELIDPGPGFALPPGADQLEVKWRWTGDEVRPCQLLERHGFDVRVWPSASNPLLSEADRQAITPLGVLDAVTEQSKISSTCDPRTGIRRFTINSLRALPGVAPSGGSGQFFWDVAYVQLKPVYIPLMVSTYRDFFLSPSLGEIPTPTVAPTPSPTFQLTPGPKPSGVITLLDPAGKPTFPANAGPVEFRWKWEGEGLGFCQVTDGYGFDLRIGSTQPGFSPLGIFNAAKSQDDLVCDPGTGIYRYTLTDLKSALGVRATFVGEYRWDGQFRWDVALVSLNPYQDPGPGSISMPSYFEISLSEYTGSLDPDGEPLSCSDFAGWTEAQAVFLKAGGPVNDPHGIDKDGNGLACDELRK